MFTWENTASDIQYAVDKNVGNMPHNRTYMFKLNGRVLKGGER